MRGFSPLEYYKELEVSRHWLGIGKVSPGARCQPCRHHPPWLAPPRAKTLLHLPLGRLQLMPGVLSTHLLVTCRNGPCGRHRSLPVLSKTRRQRRSCHHDSHVAERSHHARRAPGNSQLQARCPNPVGKGAVPNISTSYKTSRWAAQACLGERFGQGKHVGLGLRASGRTGSLFPNSRKVGENLHAAAPAARYSGLSGSCPRAL